ncbi:hypothetical protein B0I37DRAFT_117173 [Chaetomium sp. MPI-CAGE-AT-0009]|nr:hypothetical protein B0I37DRAFT_117173 [Chaetomium sp. MPI-CAGE-AT-0009]
MSDSRGNKWTKKSGLVSHTTDWVLSMVGDTAREENKEASVPRGQLLASSTATPKPNEIAKQTKCLASAAGPKLHKTMSPPDASRHFASVDSIHFNFLSCCITKLQHGKQITRSCPWPPSGYSRQTYQPRKWIKSSCLVQPSYSTTQSQPNRTTSMHRQARLFRFLMEASSEPGAPSSSLAHLTPNGGIKAQRFDGPPRRRLDGVALKII